MDDQEQAAQRDARRSVQVAADQLGMVVDDGRANPWVRAQLKRLNRGLADKSIGACGHLTSPRPSCWALWRPDVVLCLPCARERYPDDRHQAFECDWCSDEDREQMHAGIVAHGSIIVSFGLCQPCARGFGLEVVSR